MLTNQKDQYQQELQDFAHYRLKRVWTAMGVFPIAVLYIIFLIMMNTSNIDESNIRKFNYICISSLLAFQMIFLAPHLKNLSQKAKAHPNWQQELQAKVSLTLSEKLVSLLPSFGVMLIVVVAFTSFYHPNSRPDTTDEYKEPPYSVPSSSSESEIREEMDDFKSYRKSKEKK